MVKQKMVKQKGFTLIELISVIVILGILAATAIPKFVDTTSDARKASLNAAIAAMKSAASMTHGKFLINATSPQTFEGVSVTFTNGYPNAATILAVSGIAAPDYTVSTTATTATATLVTNCTATYTQAAAATTPPTYTTVTTGC